MDLARYLGTLRERIDDELRALLPPPEEDDPLSLRAAMREAVLGGGKRLRPCLAVASCEAVGGAAERALRPACALELVHAYSLVHDDLPSMDDDELRRGAPTCHVKYGEAAAILTGDALLTLAFDVLAAEGIERPGEDRLFLRACRELSRAAGALGMVGGQALDMEQKDRRPTLEQLERCHRGKTGALFAASAVIGGLLGGGGEKEIERCREIGSDLGVAFQHADDLSDGEASAPAARRSDELTGRALELARSFGEAGAPLRGLIELVRGRAVR